MHCGLIRSNTVYVIHALQEEATRQNEHLLQDKTELAALIDEKNKQIDTQQQDVQQLSKKFKEANEARVKAQAKADEAVSDANVAKVSKCHIKLLSTECKASIPLIYYIGYYFMKLALFVLMISACIFMAARGVPIELLYSRQC